MSSVVPPRSTLVLKANRDTVLLLAGAAALALAIGYSAHSRPASAPKADESVAGGWTGQLTERPADAPILVATTEPLTSAALTVPKAAMALPAPPRVAVAPKPRACEGAACAPVRAVAAPAAALPPKRPVASAPAAARPARDASLIARLNPLNHIPDMMKRPFAFAGDTIAGWVRRF